MLESLGSAAVQVKSSLPVLTIATCPGMSQTEHHGTLMGGAQFTHGRMGTLKTGVLFNGGGSYVNVPTFKHTDEMSDFFTVAVWLNAFNLSGWRSIRNTKGWDGNDLHF